MMVKKYGIDALSHLGSLLILVDHKALEDLND